MSQYQSRTDDEGARILVIGAGPTGLVAGWKLAERGHAVTIIERAPFPGGMSASFKIAGQRVDFGSHRLHGKADPGLLAELRGLMGDDLQTRQRNGRIRLAGKWVGFPLRTGDLVKHLPRRFAAGAAFDSLTAPLRKPESENFESVVRAGLGPTVFDAFYRPYARKLWGVEASEIDGSMAQRRVSAGGPIDIAKRLLAARAEEGRVFYYPRTGYGQITESLTDAVATAGGNLRCNATMTSLSLAGGVSATIEGDSGSEVLEADVIVSTVPVQHLVRISQPEPDPSVVAAAESLEHRGMVFVYLVVPRDRYTAFDAHYFPGLDTDVARLSEPKNYRDGPDTPGQTVLCAEIACGVDDELWAMSDADLGDLVAKQLVEQGLPEPEHTEVHVRRLGAVYPLYRSGYRDHLDVIERWAGTHENLITTGRQGLFVPDNLHHTVAMGRAAAESIRADGTIDQQRWAQSRETFRAHVVED